MNLLIAIIFSTIAFLSSVSKGSDICVENNKANQVQTLSQSLVDSDLISQEHQTNHNSQETLFDCQICHLGHCDFTFTHKFSFFIPAGCSSPHVTISAFSIYDFHSALFRPPIILVRI